MPQLSSYFRKTFAISPTSWRQTFRGPCGVATAVALSTAAR